VKEKVYPWGLFIENIFIKGKRASIQTSSSPQKYNAICNLQPYKNVSLKQPSSPPKPTWSPPK
jgi:hypothetical protein